MKTKKILLILGIYLLIITSIRLIWVAWIFPPPHPNALQGNIDLTAILCGIRSSRNKKLKEFYDRKRDEGKPFKVSVVACANKLIHWIFTLLKRKETFLDLA